MRALAARSYLFPFSLRTTAPPAAAAPTTKKNAHTSPRGRRERPLVDGDGIG